MSEARLDYHALAPKATRALTQLSFATGAALDERLKTIVDLRISQINGCAFCIDMHWAHLLKLDMDPRHINSWPAGAKRTGSSATRNARP